MCIAILCMGMVLRHKCKNVFDEYEEVCLNMICCYRKHSSKYW
jgi:hypothetical protein